MAEGTLGMGESNGVFAQRHDGRPETEPRPVAMQSHACAVIVADDWTVRAASGNVRYMLGTPAEAMLGRPLTEVFAEEAVNLLRAQVQTLTIADPVGHVLRCPVGQRGEMDVTVTRMGRDVCFEFEVAANGSDHAPDPQQILRLVRRATNTADMDDLARDVARMVASLTGCDRVSVHRIGLAGLDPAVGMAGRGSLARPLTRGLLQAVAEDYHPNLHLVADAAKAGAGSRLVAAEPLRIDPRALSCACPDPDLARALDRDGVRVAMTLPIRVAGDLWGAVLCHHGDEWTPSLGDRRALLHFAQLMGYEIERLQHRLGTVARTRMTMLRDVLARAVDDSGELAAALHQYESDIAAVLAHDGWLLWHGGRFDTGGRTLARDEFEEVFAVLLERAGTDALGVDRLSELVVFPRSVDPATTAVMVLPLSRVTQDCLVLFRDLTRAEANVRSWRDWEIEAGKALRAALIEVRQKTAETAREARLRVQERQGALIAELNHRMRNTLNQIQGFVGQAARSGRSVEGFARELEARIVALARAHDDLSDHDWGRAGLRLLLDRELGPYMAGPGPVARISGDRIDLSPAAFSTMALVVHELVTNARRHGALSTPSGRVDVEMALAEDGFAHLVWTESGGPPARRPRQPGYGLTLIERSVPYELRGTAALEFAPEGLVARFSLPPGQFTQVRPDAERDQRPVETPAPVPGDISIDGAALILDDSLIVALGSEELLRAAGASHVHTCNSVDAALDVLDRGEVTFAVLDVNLGRETSLAVAEQVWSDGIPAVLATGYGANEDLLSEFPPLPVLSKPFSVDEIREVLRHFRNRNGG